MRFRSTSGALDAPFLYEGSMANVLSRKTLAYSKSVNTPEYPVAEYIHNPDMSGVEGVPQQYWKLVGDAPAGMSAPEKAVVDQAVKDAAVAAFEAQMQSDPVYIALMAVIEDALNEIRVAAGVPTKTVKQGRALVSAKFRETIGG